MKQFIISTTFVVILVMVVISMAIIIPSTKIYEQTNNKIIDNQIDNVEINENQVEQNVDFDNPLARKNYLYLVDTSDNATYTRDFIGWGDYTLANYDEGAGHATR
jgi:predicted Abi (CAAX) family protease